MTLTVLLPPGCENERRYACRVLLEDFLGLTIQIAHHDGHGVRIRGPLGRDLQLDDSFFARAQQDWLSIHSLPSAYQVWDVQDDELAACLLEPRLPILFGQNPAHPDFWVRDANHIQWGVDVFGSAFFMLARYEEAVAPTLDAHHRCLGAASVAAAFDVLHRPIIDEYTEILWRCLTWLWPGLVRRQRTFSIAVSHDVDKPFEYAFRSPVAMARTVASLALKAGRVKDAWSATRAWGCAQFGWSAPDPCNNFEFIMQASEDRGLSSAFYFIVDTPAGALDADYDLSHPLMRRIIERVHQRGHEVGLHGSYLSYNDSDRLAREQAKLRAFCDSLGIRQDSWGGRQHFLRWSTPETFQACHVAGLDYDASLGYADRAGFRCGVARDYPAYDVRQRCVLPLRERPLLAMDCTIMDERYMGLGTSQAAYDALLGIKQACRRYGGTFSLLWHNSRMVDERERQLYLDILDA